MNSLSPVSFLPFPSHQELEKDKCPICYEELEDPKTVLGHTHPSEKDKIIHLIHRECFKDLQRTSQYSECVLCRRPIALPFYSLRNFNFDLFKISGASLLSFVTIHRLTSEISSAVQESCLMTAAFFSSACLTYSFWRLLRNLPEEEFHNILEQVGPL